MVRHAEDNKRQEGGVGESIPPLHFIPPGERVLDLGHWRDRFIIIVLERFLIKPA